MTISKRDLLLAMASGIAVAGVGAASPASADEAKPSQEPGHDMSGMPPNWHGNEKIAFLIYPKFTALDMAGPHYMLGNLMGATTYIVAKNKVPVVSDMGLAIVPTHSFDECPTDLDIICVPGGTEGTLAAMEDEATMAFLKDRGARAKYITSVCTGSLVLGAAGLLTGYKATSHWVAREVLKDFGAEPVDARVVIDRNRITGAGVTAGLDFGLALVAKLRDDTYAQSLQLLAEYAPEPPFNAGTPKTAPAPVRDMMAAMFPQFLANAHAAANRAMAKRG
ncbi:MAG: DJ-1/PfpI family protein [Hyphomicrobium sp.]|nr:DJ-1/PfpI family protein [Hyphomicrobium sp.]